MDMPNSSNDISPPSLPLSKQPTHRFILPTHLGLDIKLRKLLFIPRPRIIIAWIHPHFHLRVQPCVNIACGIEAVHGKLGAHPCGGGELGHFREVVFRVDCVHVVGTAVDGGDA